MRGLTQPKRCRRILARDWNGNHFEQAIDTLREITVEHDQPHALYDPTYGLIPEEAMELDKLKRGIIKLWNSYDVRSSKGR